MIYALPIVGWIIGLFFDISLAIPFWFVWTHEGIGKTYFYFLPDVYTNIGFWSCVGLFIVVPIIKLILLPSFAPISSSSK